jgi:sensor histidine kinase YesM
MSENQKTMQEFLLTLEIERAEKKAVHQQKLQQFVKQEEEQEKLIEWFENLPWYQHYSLLIFAKTKPWIEQELWPTMKAIITNMIARKIVEVGLSGTDFVLGDVPEKIFPNRFGTTISLRPGEFLTLSSEQRASNATLRKLHYSDSEFKQMKKEIEKLEKELDPALRKSKQFEKLHALRKEAATTNLVKSEKYKNLVEGFAQLDLEMATFRHLHDLQKNKETLEKIKKDIVEHGTPSTSFAEEVAEPTRNS